MKQFTDHFRHWFILIAAAFPAVAALAQPIQQVWLDDHVAVSVSVATNRVTTISFPSPIDAIDGAGITVDGKHRGCFNWPTPKVRRFFPCGRFFQKHPPISTSGGTNTPMFLS